MNQTVEINPLREHAVIPGTEDAVIEAVSLTKVYKLYKDSIDRLKEALNPFNKRYHKDFYALRD